MAATPQDAQADKTKFGTFGGVFAPNLLTILGVILFLRTGWVVGNAGLRDALIILCIANAITLLTALSLSAIATNLKVGGGGAYFLISRNLGLEIGGAIGVPLFLAQAISVAFYIVGFTESLQFLWPALDARMISSCVLAALFVVAWIGADLAIKAQYLIMAALAFSLVSFFLGFELKPDWQANIQPAFLEGQNFWSVFAIFFPAVTGIVAGVSMSGDLRDPAKSIPRGTLGAVAVCFVVYAAQMCWLAMGADRTALLTDSLVMKRIAVFPSADLRRALGGDALVGAGEPARRAAHAPGNRERRGCPALSRAGTGPAQRAPGGAGAERAHRRGVRARRRPQPHRPDHHDVLSRELRHRKSRRGARALGAEPELSADV